MIYYKTADEIKIMSEGGKILKKVVDELLPTITIGMSTFEIDKKAEELIRAKGAEPSFKTVQGYYWSTCLPINEQAVHTPPSKRTLKNGDILTIDIGVLYKGYHSDYATTIVVGESTNEVGTFLAHGETTLETAINKIKAGMYIGEISEFIQNEIEGRGYFILKDLTGHGIGKSLHEDPYVFNYLDRPVNKTTKIKPGLTIAVEIIYSTGTDEIRSDPDMDWSIITADRSLSACFERTVAVTEDKTYILT